VLCYANGYRINWQAKKIQKTGMIIVTSIPPRVGVFVDGIQKDVTPVRISYVLPGKHDVELKIEGYQVWTQSVNVEAGYVVSLDADLFYNKSKISAYTDKQIDYTLSEQPLIKKDTEIWSDNKNLVTRLSKPVLTAIWSKDKKNIFYQTDNEIRVISAEGIHDCLILKLDTADMVNLYMLSANQLVYKQNEVQKVIEFRGRVSFWPSTIKYLNF
jgi:hypothetical protein